jgi:hypothetical protein
MGNLDDSQNEHKAAPDAAFFGKPVQGICAPFFEATG